MMNSSDGSEEPGLRSRKRLITSARKEQNRIAQQLYRQRQRDRRRGLENNRRDLPGKHHQLKPRARQSAQPGAVEQTHVGAVAVLPQVRTNLDAVLNGDSPQPELSQCLDPGFHGFTPGDEFNTDGMMSFSAAPTSFFTDGDSGVFSIAPDNCEGSLPTAPRIAVDAAEAGSINGLSVPNFFDLPVISQVPLTSFNFGNWPGSINVTAPICYNPQDGLLEEGSSNTSLFPSPRTQSSDYLRNVTSDIFQDPGYVQTITIDYARHQIPGVEGIISSTVKFLYGYQIPPSTFLLPDPYMNIIPCSLAATLLAFLHNGMCIGLSIQDPFVHKSPFYNPSVKSSDDPLAVLAAARKSWIPIHLQPTLPQILIPHHPYLDLLPIPALRTRAITLGAVKPQLFCPMELKRDILKGGLFCLRGGERGEARPWDLRSWQTAPWFLGKWRLLFG